MKHIAVRSEVLNGTVGGYKISISGLGRSTQINPGRLAQPYLPYIDVKVADDAVAVSKSCLFIRECYAQCYSPAPESIWQVHNGFLEMVWQGLPAQIVDFVLKLLHAGRARHLTGAGGW